MRDILQSSDSNEDSKVFRQAKDHFKACMDLEKLEEIGHAPLKDTLKEFGGWPVLEDEWDDSQFDWYVYHFRIKQKQKLYSIYFLLTPELMFLTKSI